MSRRYQFFQNPHTVLYQTPAQAYMIIEGIPSQYKAVKLSRKRSEGSLVQCHRCRCSKSKHSKQKQKQQNKQNTKRKKRQQSCDDSKINQNTKTERQNNSSGKKNFSQAFSFKDINANQARTQINCNYKTMIEQQNLCLRRQNRFLQEYIQTLQTKYRGTVNGRRQDKMRNSKNFEMGRNSLTKKNLETIKSSDTDQGSTFSNKMYNYSKGQSSWAETYNN